MQKTSDKGIAFLVAHEGEVLKAYRCPAGIWTIGAGLTAASGVVTPHAGMTITKEEARRLLAEALGKYEARVRRAMPGATQHEFDGGVSFDYNTGRIHDASWVKAWRDKAPAEEIRRRLGMWKKAGGKVLNGLVRRRAEEADLILSGKYPTHVQPPMPEAARMVGAAATVPVAEIATYLTKLGYKSAKTAFVSNDIVRQFQRDHDLTVDGILGSATLATMRRRIDARKQANAPAVLGASGLAANEAGLSLPGWVVAVLLGVALLWALWKLWAYRDVIAAKLATMAPGLASLLRKL